MIAGYIDLAAHETKDAPLWWHKQGLQYTASGYGGKIPSSLMVKVGNRWRRIYVACYSNNGTAYILQGKDWLVVR